jgi:tetraacyldisaccharide 4'-kinase
MKLNKPKFWSIKNSIFSFLLMPITFMVILFIFFKKKFTKTFQFNVPVICVGNIYIGGTGKTPTSIFLAKELSKLGKNPTILRKFYTSHVDEHKLIKDEFSNLVLCKNRIDGLIESEKKGFDTIILDDGFQDYKIKKNLNIICFNQSQLIGNGLIIPSGPLRDNLSSLKDANIILINGNKDHEFEKTILDINKNLKIFYSCYKPTNISKFKNKKLLAVAGIGNPENFFQLIKKCGLDVQKELIFPDHYVFSNKDIQNILKKASERNFHIITTKKDYFKIKEFNLDKINFLDVYLEINEKEKFLKTINKLYNENN